MDRTAYFHAGNRGKTSVTCDFNDSGDLVQYKTRPHVRKISNKLCYVTQ